MANLKTVSVQFENQKYNYVTNCNGSVSDAEIIHYFKGKYFDLGCYPKEDMQRCINAQILPPPPTEDNNVY